MLNAILIDDETNCLKMLEWELKNSCPEVNILGMYDSGKEGLKAINKEKPDVVFLDIEMPYLNGFELLELIPNIDFDVVFTTAYDEYAVKAIKISAVDYLLKPIDGEDLAKAVARVEEKKKKNIGSENIDFLKKQLEDSRRNNIKNLALPTYEGYVFVKLEEIIYCQSDNNYATVFLKTGKKILISRTLKEVAEMLAEQDNFYRVHNSFLVNLNEIKNYVKTDGGYLVMSNDGKVKVSRSKKEELLNLF